MRKFGPIALVEAALISAGLSVNMLTSIAPEWIWPFVTVACLGGAYFWSKWDKRQKIARPIHAKSSKSNSPIPLADAITKAWAIKEMRELPEFKTLARDRPQVLYRRLSERIFDGSDSNLSIRGVIGNPPLDQTVESPEQYAFSDDLTEMIHISDDSRRYRELRVLWSDIETSIRQRTESATEGEDNGGSQ